VEEFQNWDTFGMMRHGGGKGPAVTLAAVSGLAPPGRRIMRGYPPAG
jgi:hypothetical protein